VAITFFLLVVGASVSGVLADEVEVVEVAAVGDFR